MKRFLFIGLLLVSVSLFGQANLTFYNFRPAAQSSFLNPALNPRQAVTIGLIDNFNHLYLPGITAYDIFRNDESADISVRKILQNDQYHLRDIQLYNEVNPLFIGFRVKKNYFSLGMQVTANTNMSMPKDVLTMAYYGNASDTGLFGKDVKVSDLQLNLISYSSFYVSFARDINEKLTVAVKGKYHMGLYNAQLNRNISTLKTDSGENNSLRINASTDYELRGAGIGRIEEIANDTNLDANNTAMNFLNKPVGSGFSVDLGVNYKAGPKWSFSASVLDLGYINWKEARTYAKKANFTWNGMVDFDPNGPTEQNDSIIKYLKDSVIELFKPVQTETAGYRTVFSPKFYIGAQYNVTKSGSLGFVAFGEKFAGKFQPALSINFTQRVWRLMDFRINYSYFRQNQNVGAGLNLNLGPLSIYALSDNIFGWAPIDGSLRLNSHYTTVRVGMNINIGSRYDSDNDGVPDKKDQCKKVPGLIKYNGCPDTDNDSVPDTRDECIDIKGTVAARGCPDADGDGVKDQIDSCVNEKGSMKLNGCPDRDNDGVADKYDNCPNDSGMVSRNGCPDSDGDGVLDQSDVCPDKPGSVQTNGCPDTDGDGVADQNDDCPSIPGLLQFKGCPDIDGDGIVDMADSCIGAAGPANTNGCPDSDGDGIADKYDNCPNEAGTLDNKGCPVVAAPNPDPTVVVLTEEEQKVLREAFSNLEFETGTATISGPSLESLSELADLLTAKVEYKLEISGHTDNSGNAAKNLKLSQDRANAVKNYLIDNGIAGGRVKATGFGSKKPVADNKTPEGRQKNRRVEFKIVK